MLKFKITQKICYTKNVVVQFTITPKKCCGRVYDNTKKSVVVEFTITPKKCCGKVYDNIKKMLC